VGCAQRIYVKGDEVLRVEGDPDNCARYATAAKACTAVGAGLHAAGRRCRWAPVVGASLVRVGSVCERWSVFRAGFQSAADPAYVVASQRRRLAEREAAGEPA
jgi:azurin